MQAGAAAVMLTVALAGCGSTAKSRYVSKLNKMCEDFAQREHEIATSGNPGDLQARGDRIAAAYEQAIARPIERLQAPPEIAPEARQLRDVARRQSNILRALANAGKTGDVARVRQLATVNQQLNSEAAQIAGDLNAKSCAS
jgi:outer membrane murein-binding lipoprotein Lpp